MVAILKPPASLLRELEWIEGELWANVYQTDFIVVIDPMTGKVKQRYFLPDLLESKQKPGVLNGIAYDSVSKKIWVTGKNWPMVVDFGSIQPKNAWKKP